MSSHLVFVFVAIALPFSAANYGQSQHGCNDCSQGSYCGNSAEEILNAAAAGNYQSGASLTAAADVGYEPTAQDSLAQANAQLHAMYANPSYQNYKSSYSTADSLARNNFPSNIRTANINDVAPNVLNNHQIIATQRMQPIVVNQPGSPPAHISSGPAVVVRAAPVVYKLKPSIIYQQEIMNEVPAPVSLNPVYVKLFKQGNQADALLSDPARCGHQGASFTANGAAQLAAQSGGYGAQPGY